VSAPQSGERLFTEADLPWILGLVGAGLALRLLYWSGYGLGDDVIFRSNIAAIVQHGQVASDNIAYRFTWWLPTALSCQVLGLNELGLILPTTLMATAGMVVVYAFGKALWGRPGAVIAALLLLVCPLDFAWSTMLVNDFFLAVLSATTMLLVLRAPEAPDAVWRRRLWILAGVSLWLAYHAKVSAVLLFPAIAVVCFARRREIDREFRYFVGTAAALYALSTLGSYALTGDPFAPYHAENHFGGAAGINALTSHPLTRDVFLTYPRLLFYPDHLGERLYSFYPQLLVGFVLLGPLLGLRSAWPVFWWLCFVVLGMQFAVNRVDGEWTSLARNVRHTIVFVYPMILLLTGYLVALRARWPRVCYALLVPLLAFGLRESVLTAEKTKQAFADRRQALTFIASLPPKPIHSDFQICTYLPALDMSSRFRCVEVTGDEAARRTRIAAIESGYLVTGGGREPHYGCFECIPLAREVAPEQWRLLREFPGPAVPSPWRPEAVRVWERIGPGATAASASP
jgi:hypothetical protein